MSLRVATLALATAAAATAAAQSASGPAAADATTVDAQSIEGIGDLEVTARGAAEIKRGEESGSGGPRRSSRGLGELEGRCGVRMQSGVDRFFGPSLQYNMVDETG